MVIRLEKSDPSPSAQSPSLKTCPVLRGYPLVGILPNLLLNPLQLLEQVIERYPGKVVELKIGPIRAYLATHPDHAKHILNDKWQNFGRGELKYKTVRKILGNSLLTNEGESWFRGRKLMQPLFTSSQSSAFVDITAKLIDDAIVHLDLAADKDSIYVEQEMSLLTQRVLLGTMFGSSINADQARNVAEALKVLTKEISRRIFLSFLPDWLPLMGEKKIRNAIQSIDSIILPIISKRRESGEDHNDLLDQLLRACDTETNAGMNDQQLRDECVGIYLAGFGGTSTALTWVWYLLSEYPEVEYKLQAEIDNVLGKCRPTSSDITKLRYTKMVIQESMRLYPSSWLATRVLREDDEIDGYLLKAEATVLLSPYLTHRLPQFWNQPEVFDPERFDPKRSEQLHPYAYFPFGGGPHLCMGKHFALMEMQLIIAMMVQKYRLRRVPGHPITPSPGITLHLRHGLRMTLQRRS